MSLNGSFNISAYLPRMAAQQPDTPALHVPDGKGGYRSLSFRELDQQSNRLACELEGIGIGRGVRTALMVTPGVDFFVLTFALFKVGAVPIMIDPGIGLKNLKTCLVEAEPTAFIGVPRAQVARLLFGWGKASIRTLVTAGRRWFWGGKSLARLCRSTEADPAYQPVETEADETAAILFTSGSTGVPKGVEYHHGHFIAQVEQLQRIYRIQPGEIDLPTFPLFALFAPALGMTSVIPVMDFTRPGRVDPTQIIEPIKRFKVTTMFGSPALIDRVGRYGAEQGVRLPSLRRAISAGAPVPAAVLERFGNLLNETAEVFTPYGATEALPVCSIGSREILADTRRDTEQGAGVCIGRPVPGIKLEIIHISDDPIPAWSNTLLVPEGEVGEIVVQGPQVTARYFNRPESTTLAKIPDPDSDGFYHRMGDLGYRDTQGRVWFCGRKAHRVIASHGTLFSVPCEGVYNTHPEVLRTALVGVDTADGCRPVLCVETESRVPRSAHRRICQELLELGQRHSLTRDIETILFHPSFPVDIRHNAKIFREQLARWASGKLS